MLRRGHLRKHGGINAREATRAHIVGLGLGEEADIRGGEEAAVTGSLAFEPVVGGGGGGGGGGGMV
jgi:hypothetical protein